MLVVSRTKDQSMMIGNELMLTLVDVQTERALIAMSQKSAGGRITFWTESDRRWLDVGATLNLGVGIDVAIVQVNDDKVRLGFHVPRALAVHRKEIYVLLHPFQ